MWQKIVVVALAFGLWGQLALANEAPWGKAAAVHIEYSQQKVVYDLFGKDRKIGRILDRASLISILNDADPFDSSVVIVIHGESIPHFATKNFAANRELMERAQSLSVGEVVKFRLCGAAARMRGYQPEDFHGFIEVVPMADAEIVRLQQQGYAYMQ
ncbi:MAG: DsrE family protein [Chromatiales bacterium]|nr:DsrE family protein [Gammaproteobacteria bacterium]MBW6477553.1 DsrE family protein [Chromatiales bacterium]